MNIENHIDAEKSKITDALHILKKGLAEERVETREMLETYLKFTQQEITMEQLDVANKQFRDLLKTLGLGVFLALPFSYLTLPAMIKFAKKLGVDILPAPFKKLV